MNFVVPDERRKEYLKRREAECLGFSDKDFDDPKVQSAFMTMLHQIKGNAKTFGFEALGIECGSVEAQIKKAPSFPTKEEALALTERFKNLVSEFKQSLS